jgi:DNA-binding response OmpR family regulator
MSSAHGVCLTRNVKVLVVDDEAEVLALCRMVLESAGHHVRGELSGEDALLAAYNDPPDAIVLDFMMPGTDGLSVLERLRRGPSSLEHVPVLMLSARGQPEDARRGLAAGATAYLTKPFEVDELSSLLTTIVAETPAERDLRRVRAMLAMDPVGCG